MKNGEKLTLALICLFFAFVLYNMCTPNTYHIEYIVTNSEGVIVEAEDTVLNAYSTHEVCDKLRGGYSDAFNLEMKVTCLDKGGYDRIVRQ